MDYLIDIFTLLHVMSHYHWRYHALLNWKPKCHHIICFFAQDSISLGCSMWSSVSDSYEEAILNSSTWATLRVSKCIGLRFLSAVKTLTSSSFRLCHLSITIVRSPHSYWTHRGCGRVCGVGGRKVIYVNEYFLFNWTPPSLLITFPV